MEREYSGSELHRHGILATGLLAAAAVWGQNVARPEFEVAAIKPAGSVFSTRPERSVGRIRWTTQVKYLIGYAYGLDLARVDGEGLGSIYSLEATFDPAATDDQVRSMTQSLLAERFKLKARLVTREADGWTLQVGRHGLKIREAREDEPPPPLPERLRNASPSLRDESFLVSHVLDRGVVEIIGRRVSMAQLAAELQTSDAPVWDRTGLTGRYYFAFRYAEGLSAEADAQVSYPQLRTALEETLGLEMKKQKGPVEVLVVDHIEAPSGN